MLITPCIIRTLYLLNKLILHQHYIAKVLFHYTCCGAGRSVCQGVVDNGCDGIEHYNSGSFV